MLRGDDVTIIRETKERGLSIVAACRETGYDPKTIRRYLRGDPSDPVPRYGPREKSPSKLDPHAAYIDERLRAAVWNVVVLLRELKNRGYDGGYTILREDVQPKRTACSAEAVRRFTTPPDKQAQVDWAEVGSYEENGIFNALSREKHYHRVMFPTR